MAREAGGSRVSGFSMDIVVCSSARILTVATISGTAPPPRDMYTSWSSARKHGHESAICFLAVGRDKYAAPGGLLAYQSTSG